MNNVTDQKNVVSVHEYRIDRKFMKVSVLIIYIFPFVAYVYEIVCQNVCIQLN